MEQTIFPEFVHEMEMDFGDAGKHPVQVFYTYDKDDIRLLRIRLYAWDITKMFDDTVLEDVRFDIQDARWKRQDAAPLIRADEQIDEWKEAK